MRNSGWLSLSSDFQVTGLPRSLCKINTHIWIQKFDKFSPRHGVVPRPSPLRLRSLTAEEEASLTKIKKASHSPISLMHVEASDTSLSSILPSLVAKVAEQAPSLVVIRSLILIKNLQSLNTHFPKYSTSLFFSTSKTRGAAAEPGSQSAWPGYSHLVKSGWMIHHHVSLQVALEPRLVLNCPQNAF